MLKFKFKKFSCDVDIFTKDDDLVARFYDHSREQTEEQIIDLVIVDPGFGYLSLKLKGEDALISGFLCQEIFDEEMTNAAIAFLEGLSPKSDGAYIPHHVALMSKTSYVEYNGEY